MGRKKIVQDMFDVDVIPVRKTRAARKQATNDNVVIPIQPNIKKSFNIKDLKKVTPLTDNQSRTFYEWDDGKNVVLEGHAGVGKSFLALYLALKTVLDPHAEQKRIIIVRSVVQTRNIGYLPGTEDEKLAPYEAPYKSICDELFTWKNSYDNLKELGIIQFECSSFLRGTTFNDAIIIFDEIQNGTDHEISTVITRVGKNSRIILCGDDLQNDIGRDSGFSSIIPILRRMRSVSFVDFTLQDIVRSGFVKEFLMAKYQKLPY